MLIIDTKKRGSRVQKDLIVSDVQAWPGILVHALANEQRVPRSFYINVTVSKHRNYPQLSIYERAGLLTLISELNWIGGCSKIHISVVQACCAS